MGWRWAVAIAGFLCLAAPAAQAQGFLGAAVDIPLMAGLTEVDGLGVVFDKPDGRIVEAYAVGSVSASQVERFYGEALPQLGWQAQGERLYERGSEKLRLTFGGQDGAITVRFDITPR